jgi:hypothetical protein
LIRIFIHTATADDEESIDERDEYWYHEKTN